MLHSFCSGHQCPGLVLGGKREREREGMRERGGVCGREEEVSRFQTLNRSSCSLRVGSSCSEREGWRREVNYLDFYSKSHHFHEGC